VPLSKSWRSRFSRGGVAGLNERHTQIGEASFALILQELFGVNADIRRHCDELAEQGFLAVAPDLFWRQEPGVDLGVTSDADWAHGLRLYGAWRSVRLTSGPLFDFRRPDRIAKSQLRAIHQLDDPGSPIIR
jgi:dienelactone hydrolase